MRKELRPVHDDVACEVCGRTILKGEQTETFVAPGGERRRVCELCATRASSEGWIRESAYSDAAPSSRRSESRRSLWSRVSGWASGEPAERPWVAGAEEGAAAVPDAAAEPPAAPPEPVPAAAAPPPSAEPAAPAPAPPAPGPEPARHRDPGAGLRERIAGRRPETRHVRAVPTGAHAKVERAFELFNASDETRTIAGIARSLGEPWVCALPLETAPHEVVIVVAWELSWYRYRVDLGDADQPVLLLEKGDELDQLDAGLRAWNAEADADGRLTAGVGTARP